MKTLLRATLLLVILLVLALLLGQAGMVPVPVTVTIGTLQLQTTAPVAITLALTLLLGVFYLGRLTGWMLRLPTKWLNRRKVAAADAIADGYTSLAMMNNTAATQHLGTISTSNPALNDLLTLLRVHTNTITPTQANQALANARLAPVAALYLARNAAQLADWPEVKRLTSIGRQSAPNNLPLQTLQFKALVNLNDPAAQSLLPIFKTTLGSEHHKLLTQILQGPTALTAGPVLGSPWVRAVQAWLPTPSDTFPTE